MTNEEVANLVLNKIGTHRFISKNANYALALHLLRLTLSPYIGDYLGKGFTQLIESKSKEDVNEIITILKEKLQIIRMQELL